MDLVDISDDGRMEVSEPEFDVNNAEMVNNMIDDNDVIID